MTVVHVIPFLWSGAGRVVVRLCEAQRALGHRVHVVTSGSSKGQADWPAYRRALARMGASWHRIDTFDRSAESFWSTVNDLACLLDDVRPHVVHAHAGVPATALELARRDVPRRVPLVAQMYSWGPDRPAWMDRMDLWGFRQADAVLWSADAYRRRLADAGVPSSRLHRLRLGIDPPRATRPAHRRPAANGGTLVFVGRLEPRKRQHLLVDVVDALRERRPRVRLVLAGPAGDPDYAEALRRDVARRGLDTNVRVAGKVVDIWTTLARADLFVSVSADEGQGLAVLEAMAAGVPVAAHAVAGVEDYLDTRTGVVLRSDHPTEIAAALAAALDDPDALDARARRAAAMVARAYRWDDTVRRVMAVYATARRRAGRATR